MQRQKKQLIIIFIMLIFIIFLLAGMKIYNKKHAEEEDTITYPVTQSDAADVTAFSLTNENGSFSFTKVDGTWYENSDRSMKIDTYSLETVINAAVSISSENRMEQVEDLSQYGLDAPEITVIYTTKEDSTVIEIGNYNSTISLYYVRMKGEDTVYTIDGATRNSFTKNMEDFKAIETEEQ